MQTTQKEEELLDKLLGESDFNYNEVQEEMIGSRIRVNLPNDKMCHQREGQIGGVYRPERNEPVDAYWIFFDDWKLDSWFLPTELELVKPNT